MKITVDQKRILYIIFVLIVIIILMICSYFRENQTKKIGEQDIEIDKINHCITKITLS